MQERDNRDIERKKERVRESKIQREEGREGGRAIQFHLLGENIIKQRDRVCEIMLRNIGIESKKKGGSDREEVCKRDIREIEKERGDKRE